MDDFRLAILKYLNRRNEYFTHYYDCGERGVLKIEWVRNKWYTRWIEIEPLPEELAQNFKVTDVTLA